MVLISVSSNAVGKTVEELKKAGDLRGLVAKLDDHQATVRREAAVALPGVVKEVKDPATLDSVVGRLIDVRLRDPWKSTREYSGRALMYVLNKTKDQRVLSDSVPPLLDALDRGQVDVELRRYAAVALSVVVMRLESVDRIRPRFIDLLSSALQDRDEGVRKYAERALQHTLQKLDHEPTLILAAGPLAAQLESKDPHARSYSAEMLAGVVRKIKDPGALKSLLGRITAATKDPDKGVGECSGRALQHIQRVLKEEQKPAAPEKGKASTKAGNSPAAARNVAIQIGAAERTEQKATKAEEAKKPSAAIEDRLNQMDSNHDKNVSEEEFVAAHKKMGEALAKDIFKHMGGTKGKGLTFEQYKEARESWEKKHPEHKAHVP
jgi:hypothetical protein